MEGEPTPPDAATVNGDATAPGTAGPSDDQSDGELPDPAFQEQLRNNADYRSFAGRSQIQRDAGATAPLLLEPGTYTTDSMRTPMTFTLDQPWRLLVESPTSMVLVDHERADILWGLPLIQFNRPMALVDPADTSHGPLGLPRTIDGWDYDGWFAAHPALEVGRTEVMIGGLASVRYDIAHSPGADVGWSCADVVRCTHLTTLWGGGVGELRSDTLAAYWVIPQGDGPPLTAVAAASAEEGWGDFLAHAEDLLASIEFGPIVEQVFSDRPWEEGISSNLPVGPIWFPIGGGVAFEIPEALRAEIRPGWSWLQIEQADFSVFPPNVELAMAIQGIDGTPIETADELAEILVDRAGAERVEDGQLLGQPAIRVQMFGVRPNELMFTHVAIADGVNPRSAGWFTQDYVELWATETPDGVFILTAEAESAELLQVALALHEFVRGTLVLDPR